MKTSALFFLAATFTFQIATAQTPSDTLAASRYSLDVNVISENGMNNRDQATNALDAIRGRVAGLTVERNGTNAMNAVRLRGTTSLTGGNDPLIIVDGVMGDLSLLDNVYPTDIESFVIKKDASETSQYGSTCPPRFGTRGRPTVRRAKTATT